MLGLLLSTTFLDQDPLPPASELLSALVQTYRVAGTARFLDSIGDKNSKDQVVFNWGLGVLISAENAVARNDRRYVPLLKQTLEMSESYWNPKGPVAGYDVLPGPHGGKDRYYDDNAWMVMALVESYEITRETKWLDRAKAALEYVLSGSDDVLGGGIYWRENEKNSKNTCSNGPAAAACLAVYSHTKSKPLLDRAKSLYQWTYDKLRDPEDNLYWDAVKLDGSVEKTKWSYNSALMLRSAKALAKWTGEAKFKNQAKKLEAACQSRWLKSSGQIADELQFAHLLFENMDLSPKQQEQCLRNLLGARDENGWFGHRWGEKATGPKRQLIHQASAIRALAHYQARKSDSKAE
ncbi:MAG: hypothetical protein JST40_05010 [Armatimonadetes bacterium]|nr:hypothetical protein [Armatimonadota bacterium]